jgi:hypothetical protein
MLAQRSFCAVAEHFKDEPRVEIRALYNTWTPERPVPAREIPVSSVAEGGYLRYGDVGALEKILQQRFQAAQESGKYPAELLQLLGQGLPGVPAPGERRDRSDPDQEPLRRPHAP